MTSPTQQLLVQCERLKELEEEVRQTLGTPEYHASSLAYRTFKSELAPILARLMPVMVGALERWLIRDDEGFYPDELPDYTPTLSPTAKQALSKIEEEFPPEEKK
jgi:hypothetical protein